MSSSERGWRKLAENGRKGAVFDCLLQGMTIRATAAKTKVGERTIQRWLSEDAAFANSLAQARTDISESLMRRIISSGEMAMATLSTIAQNQKASPTARVMACRSILEHFPAAVERLEILERLKKIEEATTE